MSEELLRRWYEGLMRQLRESKSELVRSRFEALRSLREARRQLEVSGEDERLVGRVREAEAVLECSVLCMDAPGHRHHTCMVNCIHMRLGGVWN